MGLPGCPLNEVGGEDDEVEVPLDEVRPHLLPEGLKRSRLDQTCGAGYIINKCFNFVSQRIGIGENATQFSRPNAEPQKIYAAPQHLIRKITIFASRSLVNWYSSI
jgi:hypothetical protein